MMRVMTAIYAPGNRWKLLLLAGLLVVAIAIADWRTTPYFSIGFLYLFPIMLAAGFLSRVQIVSLAVLCAVLQEEFSNLPSADAITRLILTCAGFVGTGLFISELIRNRRLAIDSLREVENQIQLRQDAEEQLQVLVESSPAAIVTVDSEGSILLANEAAQQLLAPDGQKLTGQQVGSYLPALLTAVQSRRPQAFRTAIQCRGQSSTGEVFLAGVWFSTYSTRSGKRLAAIAVDLSEDLRNREDLSLDTLLKNTRILMSAVSHEVRNLCGAALVVHKNLARVKALGGNADFEALGTLIEGLEKLSALELRTPSEQERSAIELASVLDELRVLIEPAYHESNMQLHWMVDEALPLVWADRYALMQVFLNLAKNSRRAMQDTAEKQLTIVTSIEDQSVAIRFQDTGVGIANAHDLFRPFQRGAEATGLGLYVSRALTKSFGGDLVYEPCGHGCRFAVMLQTADHAEGVLDD
jgi:two-component system, LuxR family, sensor kinase FixL